MSQSEHVALSRSTSTLDGQTFTCLPLAVKVEYTEKSMTQIICQVWGQTGELVYTLPYHTRTLSLQITDIHGKAMTSSVAGTEGKHTLTAFRKSGVVELESHGWVKLAVGDYSVVLVASSMILHKKRFEPEGLNERAYTGGFPAGYV